MLLERTFRNLGGEERPIRWLGALIVLASLCLPATLGETGVGRPLPVEDDPSVTSWLSKSEADRLMRYHGVLALKITGDKVFIRREGRWIRVHHDPPLPLERSIPTGRSRDTVLAASGGP
jgi:hypothetical protein